jgi:hypothetical protein
MATALQGQLSTQDFKPLLGPLWKPDEGFCILLRVGQIPPSFAYHFKGGHEAQDDNVKPRVLESDKS